MGHWSEALVDELTTGLNGPVDRDEIRQVLLAVSGEIEVLSGRGFDGVHASTETFAPNGLPLVDVPDAHVGSLSSSAQVWAVPDPTNPTMATVLQLVGLTPVRKAAAPGEAMWLAGQVVARLTKGGYLSADYAVHWIGNAISPADRGRLFRAVMNPNMRFYIPVYGEVIEGWWIQVSRRLVWVTNETRDEGRLLEPLLGDPISSDRPLPPLAATEPVLTVARLTSQPVDWAMTARIWVDHVRPWTDRRWTDLAPAIHGHGVPVVMTDVKSTVEEIACQVVLKAFWHGYISGDEPAVGKAVGSAYSSCVERIQRRTAMSREAASAALLEQLIAPGFDPGRGAEAARRYVRRKASIVVLEHHKLQAPERYPWTRVGVTERHFYKLLPHFASKVGGRYVYDHDDVVLRMRAHLGLAESDREIRALALVVLRERGFSEAAARKWLQRHPVAEAVNAVPRSARGSAP